MSELSVVESDFHRRVALALTRCLKSDLRQQLVQALLEEDGYQWQSILDTEADIRNDALTECLKLKEEDTYAWVEAYSHALDKAIYSVRRSFFNIKSDVWVEEKLDRAISNPAPWLTMLLAT